MLRNFVVLTAVLLIATGCASRPSVQLVEVSRGIIKTEGVVITSEDGAPFVLRSGEIFNTPFSSDLVYWERDSIGRRGALYECIGHCRAVRVKVPGHEQPLYGALYFSKMHPTASGPGSRTYLIEIPDRYIREATDGRVSVIYELVDTNNGAQAGWVLWLSDMPLR